MMKNELLLSAIPARALYQAAKAARIPKAPPALRQAMLPCWRYEIPSMRNARSSVKKRKKKATVERSVQMSRMKVKINQP